MSKNLIIVLSDEEYDAIHNKAKEKGISASKYAYDILFKNKDSFESKWILLMERIEQYPSGAEFDISIIVGVALWQSYDRGTKLSLARTLKRKIDDGSITNVEVVGRSASNITIYRKK